MIVGVISDTHGLMRPEALAALRGSAHIVHAGDIGAPGIVERLAEIAPVTAIRGNVDAGRWTKEYPHTVTVVLAERTILIVHDRSDLRIDPAREGIDVVISGHSHQSSIETLRGVLYLNPGAAGPRRFRLPVTVARLDLAAAPHAEIVTLETSGARRG